MFNIWVSTDTVWNQNRIVHAYLHLLKENFQILFIAISTSCIVNGYSKICYAVSLIHFFRYPLLVFFFSFLSS